MTVQELQETFRIIFGRETVVANKFWLIWQLLLSLENSSELREYLNLVRCRIASNENVEKNAPSSTCTEDVESFVKEKPKEIVSNSLTSFSSVFTETRTSSHEKGHGEGLLVKGKRPHKPPRRLIEESLEPKFRASSGKRCGTNRKSSEIKPLHVKSPEQALKQLSHKGNEAMLSVHEEESFSGACIQVPFGLPVEEEPVKETLSSLALSIVSVSLLIFSLFLFHLV